MKCMRNVYTKMPLTKEEVLKVKDTKKKPNCQKHHIFFLKVFSIPHCINVNRVDPVMRDQCYKRPLGLRDQKFVVPNHIIIMLNYLS